MQYSSALISSKLRAQLATYVRQLCKISDRARAQNLTGREQRNNDRMKGGWGGYSVREGVSSTGLSVNIHSCIQNSVDDYYRDYALMLIL